MNKPIFLIGDIHGNWKFLKHIMRSRLKGLTGYSLIQVGDYGLGFDPIHVVKEHHDKLEKELIKADAHLYVIRGNHDDPQAWTDQLLNYSRIHFVNDHIVINFDGTNIFFWGGAASVDKRSRIEEGGNILPTFNERSSKVRYWFEDEDVDFSFDFETLENIDIVVTHTAPSYTFPSLNSRIVDLNPNCFFERTMMSDEMDVMLKKNNIKKWYHGHFHESNSAIIKDIEFNSLGINEVKELRL
jgi:UDP-2,3-diacylglucosamine pyrophosphatase LpxH